MIKKHRGGSNNYNAKINEEDVLLIRELFAERCYLIKKAKQLTLSKIADKFGISYTSCYDIVSGKSWQHVVDKFLYNINLNEGDSK